MGNSKLKSNYEITPTKALIFYFYPNCYLVKQRFVKKLSCETNLLQ